MKSRTAYLMRIVFYPFIPVLLVIASQLSSKVIGWIIVAATLIVTGCFIAMDTHCPHCKSCGLVPRPHRPHAGYCTRCGKLVEWKESQN